MPVIALGYIASSRTYWKQTTPYASSECY
jgi:hypothetical protein